MRGRVVTGVYAGPAIQRRSGLRDKIGPDDPGHDGPDIRALRFWMERCAALWASTTPTGIAAV